MTGQLSSVLLSNANMTVFCWGFGGFSNMSKNALSFSWSRIPFDCKSFILSQIVSTELIYKQVLIYFNWVQNFLMHVVSLAVGGFLLSHVSFVSFLKNRPRFFCMLKLYLIWRTDEFTLATSALILKSLNFFLFSWSFSSLFVIFEITCKPWSHHFMQSSNIFNSKQQSHPKYWSIYQENRFNWFFFKTFEFTPENWFHVVHVELARKNTIGQRRSKVLQMKLSCRSVWVQNRFELPALLDIFDGFLLLSILFIVCDQLLLQTLRVAVAGVFVLATLEHKVTFVLFSI